jgi:hypothetical protein
VRQIGGSRFANRSESKGTAGGKTRLRANTFCQFGFCITDRGGKSADRRFANRGERKGTAGVKTHLHGKCVLPTWFLYNGTGRGQTAKAELANQPARKHNTSGVKIL